ncbi:hypothetical protein ACT80S_09625 [Ramlibacter sp. MAHUQ-53]|uniref:hypothetical protein n=1 Tax=unclassified Ramlibacter TaxID=2617605 RepID=UPI00363FFD93
MRGVDSARRLVRYGRWGSSVLLLLWLVGCASPGGQAGASAIPGGHPVYNFGVAQDRVMFERQVARAQVNYSPHSQRAWGDFSGGEGSGFIVGLTGFYPLDVRWKLKDGRQFIAERVDVGRLVREFAETRQILLQHQRERRTFGPTGDHPPLFAIAVADGWLVLKWQIVFNLRPVAERLKPPGTVGPAVYVREEHIVATVPGTPAQDIDFDSKWDTVPERVEAHVR